MILALAGGVGGAKLAHGLARVLSPSELVIAVNTGDDFQHLDYFICPDLDSVLYKLAGINDTERGWGIRDETWNFMESLKQIGGEDWFLLGDKDLETHIERTRRLSEGQTLSEVTRALSGNHGVMHTIVPMTDHRVGTIVDTKEGDFFFQDYFVRLRCEPAFTGVHYKGMEKATPSPALKEALTHSDLKVIIICPSNPFVSIDPILNVPGIGDALAKTRVPIVAVSPIIDGQAVKGPAAKMMRELGLPVSPIGIAQHYGDLITGLVIDEQDRDLSNKITQLGTKVHVAPTLMKTPEDEKQLALESLRFAEALAKQHA
ncbi:MAG: 2-phospho-L-lactate transferase [Rhodospirillaceae bacterium]|nr:2-phospho-L-lactate transferase [Rhodospirillaceae bacterium]|tara:strand:+ start:11027 stop:11977 length:951 start_codon:yes stop_codon:yes gene_type:complete